MLGANFPDLGVPQTLLPPSCEDALIIGPRVEEGLRKQDQREPEPKPGSTPSTDREASRLPRSNFTYLSSSTAHFIPGMPISEPDAERQ